MVPPVRVALELELPDGEHRDRLLDALGNLIRRRGFESFVGAPILLPQSEFFPERWERNLAGARRLLRRLMHYAGLGQFEVSLESWRERAALAGELRVAHAGNDTAAWFAGFREGVCEFGLELEQLRNEESLVATLGHEVAHAYRHHHGLVIRDPDLEEKLTDLTCVYLGFGAFSLNASHVVKTGGYDSSGGKLLYETRSLGYLAPNEFALLLGAQLAIRNRPEEQRAVCEVLSANHAALVNEALRQLAREAEELRRRLAIPDPSAWPAHTDDVERRAPLPDEDEQPDSEMPAADETSSSNGVVFRVRRHRAVGSGALALGVAAMSGRWVGMETYAFYGLCAAGTALGAVLGRRLRADECSGCRARLGRDDDHCAACGGELAGEIANRDDRLEAEERHFAARGNAATDDDDEEEEEDPVAVLFTAMLAAWTLSRGMLVDDAAEADKELSVRVRELDFDTDALYDAWVQGLKVTDEAARFADYYCLDPAAPRTHDFEILTTANELDARPANYQRFAAILDRRFSEWKARDKDATSKPG